MTIPSELLGVIDSRVLAFTQQPFAMGTLLSRDSSGAGGLASFDGDETGVPVKVLANVQVFPPDRVLMVRVIGSGLRQPDLDDTRKPSPGEWVVIGGFTLRNGTGTRVSTNGIFAPAGITNAGASFTTMDGIAVLSLTKRFDSTRIHAGLSASLLINGINVRAQLGVRLNSTDYPLDLIHATSAQHMGHMGQADIAGLPAGDYLATARYRQDAAGTIGANNADSYSFWVEEVGP